MSVSLHLIKFIERSSKLIKSTNFTCFHINLHYSSYNMSKTACVILAPGAEEMEFTICADVLRRAGINVTVAGLLGKEPVKCANNIVIVPDASLESIANNDFDAIIMPGGLGGSNAMAESKLVKDFLKKQESSGRIIGSICAAPIGLLSHGICLGKNLTSYPAFKDKLCESYKYVDNQKVVQDGNLITSQGPGTAFDFALKVAEVLSGKEQTAKVAKAMLL